MIGAGDDGRRSRFRHCGGGRIQHVQIPQGAQGLFSVRSVRGIRIGVDHASIGGAGLGVLVFDGEVLAQREPVCGCGFFGRIHQGKFPFDRRGALLAGPLSDCVSHLARHRFNLFMVPDRGFHSVGFQTVIERVGMILNQVRPLLVGIVGTTGSYQAAGNEHH
jgi:hypothetical protein